jgi:FKBP-type peptidyl-prolyl cis-trans isomerase 2
MTNTVQKGQTVSVHYKGTLDDGTEFDNSRNRGKVMKVEVGSGQLISGFDTALMGMTVGEIKSVALTPEDAYGPVTPRRFFHRTTSSKLEKWFRVNPLLAKLFWRGLQRKRILR